MLEGRRGEVGIGVAGGEGMALDWVDHWGEDVVEGLWLWLVWDGLCGGFSFSLVALLWDEGAVVAEAHRAQSIRRRVALAVARIPQHRRCSQFA